MTKKKKKQEHHGIKIKRQVSSRKIGLPAGTLLYVGTEPIHDTQITVTQMVEGNYVSSTLSKKEFLESKPDKSTPLWVDVAGLHDGEIISYIGQEFGLHRLVQEDIMNTMQRSKFEIYSGFVFCTVKVAYPGADTGSLLTEQVTMVISENWILTFQENNTPDLFLEIRERIRKEQGKIEIEGTLYLLYVIMDSLVDNYFEVLERFEDEMDMLDDMLMEAIPFDMRLIFNAKKSMIVLRKCVIPLQDIMNGILRYFKTMMGEHTEIYYNDVADHVLRLSETLELYRETINNLYDSYLSQLSVRMNGIMKVLTVISSIFIPLTFIVGVYGMNFRFMPELNWHWGYPAVMLFMLVLSLVMLFLFRKRKWL